MRERRRLLSGGGVFSSLLKEAFGLKIMDKRQAAYLAQVVQAAVAPLVKASDARFQQFLGQMISSEPPSVTEEADAIEGRRIFYNLTDEITFDITQNRRRGDPLTFQISQDGPYLITHFPLVMWRPSAPENADNFGRWSPVSSWPLPTQQNLNTDVIDLSWELQDSGNQRNFQNEVSNPTFSRPDIFEVLPVPTLLSPNSVTQFFPTYENILFNAGQNVEVPATQGKLRVTFMGYRIVNL